jgi:hypothetical protein
MKRPALTQLVKATKSTEVVMATAQPTEAKLYLKLFHGRTDLNEKMDDWGSDGPIFGPLAYVHTTYRDRVHIGGEIADLGDLFVVEDCLYYGGIYYGDWSAFITNDATIADIVARSGHWTEQFDEVKADPNRNRSASNVNLNPAVEQSRVKHGTSVRGGRYRDCAQGILGKVTEGFEYFDRDNDGRGFWFCCYCGSNHVTIVLDGGETIAQGDLY